MIRQVSVGTTATKVISQKDMYYGDILILNNSANIVEVIDAESSGYGTGIVLAANGGFMSDRWNDRNLWLIASGASSDVRVSVQYHPKGYV